MGQHWFIHKPDYILKWSTERSRIHRHPSTTGTLFPDADIHKDMFLESDLLGCRPRRTNEGITDEDPVDYPADRDDDDEEEVKRLLALTTPPPSPLTPLSSPLPQIPSPLLPASPPASLLSSDHRTDRPEITLPPQKRLGVDLGPRIRDVWVDPRETVEEVAPMTLEGVNTRVTELTAVQEQDTQDIYVVIRDTQDRQTQIYQSVETLVDDSQYHYETARLLDQEALVSREAWGRSIEVSYMIRSDIMALCSVVMGQHAVIAQLQAADSDHQRQVQLTKALKLLKGLQTQMADLLSIMGYSQLADCIDLLFCLATQYRSFVQVARECTYSDFLKCQPLNFKGTEGVVGLTQWFEKMDSVYSISNCTVACHVKFATCTLQGNALTLWNSHVKTTIPEAAHAMPWRTLKKIMTGKYCPRGEIKKLEFEM
ncbi:hypothetical protein Tco_0908051 [Tanacetum coccineum]|uniref:Uncharacterized protein n=1 Tax=Tanacetum coccineum TaxID=301880 RepID=A0ABQ5CL09_9ASTR